MIGSNSQLQKVGTRNFTRALLFCIGALLIFVVAGCDRSHELVSTGEATSGPRGQLASAALSPKVVIEECLAAYKQLSSYEDQAFVQLSYEFDGEVMVDRAPLSIAWDDHGRLGLRVYQIEAGPDADRWRLRLGNNASLQGQVISRAVPERVDLNWLLTDPVVAEQVAAGLAGFPPQLDLLLNPRPMQSLLDASAAFSFEPQDTVEGRACYVIAIERSGLLYRLWIDQASMLVRRVQIPNENIPQEIRSDTRLRRLQLSIEIRDIVVNKAPDWSRFRVSVEESDAIVQRFVLPAPAVDTRGLGARIPAFRLLDIGGQEVYNSVSSSGSQRKATVLVWLADHPGCRLAAEQISRVAQALQLAGVGEEKVEFVSVWAEPRPPVGETFGTLARAWDLQGSLAVDREAIGRDLFGIEDAPTLIVLDSRNRVQLRESRTNPLLDQALPQLLIRIAAGEDIAQDLVQKSRWAAARFEADLAMAAAMDSVAADPARGERMQLEPYPPALFQLQELSVRPFKTKVEAAVNSHDGQLWALQKDGRLVRFSNSPAETKSYSTNWTSGTNWLAVSHEAEYVACLRVGDREIRVLDVARDEVVSLELQSRSQVLDMQWLHMAGTKVPRLALVTQDSEVILLDPQNHEQLRGTSPSRPIAILEAEITNTNTAGMVVLADGSLEPIELSHESTLGGKQAGSRQAASLPSPTEKAFHLVFKPDSGPWLRDRTRSEVTLARGWLAKDEPAIYLLGSDWLPVWHVPVPLRSKSTRAIANAVDPKTGQLVWATLADSNTVYLLRADGRGSDHFRVERDVLALGLNAIGDRLELTLVHSDKSITYRVDW